MSEWPKRGPAFNVWNCDVALFAKIVQENPGLWLSDMDLKYLNLRIDTRSGTFLIVGEDGEQIDADRVVDAAHKARRSGMNTAYTAIQASAKR